MNAIELLSTCAGVCRRAWLLQRVGGLDLRWHVTVGLHRDMRSGIVEHPWGLITGWGGTQKRLPRTGRKGKAVV